MSTPAIRVENLGKRYKLGLTHAGSVRELVNRACGGFFRGNQKSSIALRRKPSEPGQVDEDNYYWALKNIDLEIQEGEVVGLIGRNGAGKSTLLKVLSRITRPTEGRAVIRGRVAALLEVGTGFHPELTGRENVFLNGTILGMTKVEVKRQFDAIVDFAGIEAFVDTPVKRYSSGMTVRLGFAVAAHLQPEVLIVDEVLAVGDAAFQEKCIGKMSDMGSEGRTVLFVSHNMAAIESLTRKCIVIDNGRGVFEGQSDEAVDHYLHRQDNRLTQSKDVSSLPRVAWAGDRSVEFQTAELLGLNDGVLAGGRGLRIKVVLGATENVDALWFGITLHYRDGTPVFSSFSEVFGPVSRNNTATFEISIGNPGIAPGHYWFTIAALRRDHKAMDIINEVLHFRVTDPRLLPPGLAEWSGSWGRIRTPLQSRWTDQNAVSIPSIACGGGVAGDETSSSHL